MRSSPEFSVIVLNWNGKHFLPVCLESLRAQTFRSFEIVLVDNGSEDGSVEFVQAKFPEVRVVALSENTGFSGGNNSGIRQATGRWIVLLNNDTELDSHFLESVWDARLKYPETAMFAPKMIFDNARDKIDNCGFLACISGSTLNIGRDQTGLSDHPFGPSGGAAFYSRKLLEDVGMLDEDFFMTYEDYDLAFRARLRGYDCRFVEDAIVYHRYRGTMRNYSARQVYFSQRNVEFVYLKDMPGALIFRYGLLHLIYNIGGMAYFTRMGQLRPFLRAKWDAIKAIPQIISKRRGIQESKVLSAREVRNLLVTNWFGAGFRKAIGRRERAAERG